MENPGFVQELPQTRVWVQITVISRLNHGYNTGKSWLFWGWKPSPPEIYLRKIEKSAVSRLNVTISAGVYQKKSRKDVDDVASNSTHAGEIKWAEP